MEKNYNKSIICHKSMLEYSERLLLIEFFQHLGTKKSYLNDVERTIQNFLENPTLDAMQVVINNYEEVIHNYIEF